MLGREDTIGPEESLKHSSGRWPLRSTVDGHPDRAVRIAGRSGPNCQQTSGNPTQGFLYFLAVYWHHADSQLRKGLHMEARILRRREVERLTLLSKASIYRQMQMGTFPMPLKLGPRAVAWLAEEIHEWIASRPRATGDVPRSGHAS